MLNALMRWRAKPGPTRIADVYRSFWNTSIGELRETECGRVVVRNLKNSEKKKERDTAKSGPTMPASDLLYSVLSAVIGFTRVARLAGK